jgi:hypothetical protein
MAPVFDLRGAASAGPNRRRLKRLLGKLLEQAGEFASSPFFTVESALAWLQQAQTLNPPGSDSGHATAIPARTAVETRARDLAAQLGSAWHQLKAGPMPAARNLR